MEVRITMDGARADVEQRSLYKWLREDRELRAVAGITLVGSEPEEPGAGAMGTTLDVVSLVINSALQLSSVAVAIAAWKEAHRPRSRMVIERDGVKITVSDGCLDEAQALLRALERGVDR
ncbi:hypothetical protein AB0I94_32525 [Streptomyces sp. NPDC050147]|uniref:effector-associated constant component EACC1 n=1 Tax=Streptomyces sp. NPDC050147 TaxID=3155513 RepID=UPI00342B57BB